MTKLWYSPSTPDEIQPNPWLHPSVIDYLEKILQPGWSVLEHGCGGSTLWFAHRVEHVVSVEHDPAWRDAVRKIAPANVTILTELPGPGKKYDLFLIDGERSQRGLCLTKAGEYVPAGRWVVLDNANRPEYVEERFLLSDHATLVQRFDNNIPCSKYFVTEIWLCE